MESHDGTSYQAQAQMQYNGLGQRLALTAHQGGQSLIMRYLLDSDTLLAVTFNNQITYYLPGLAEHTNAWSYYLPDGQQTMRQMINAKGQVHRHNGVVSTDTLDPVGRLVDRVHANESTTLASYHYEYEPAGNRWQATERMLGYPNFLPVILNPESGGGETLDGMEKAYPAPSEGEPLPLEKGAPKEDAYPAPETTKQSSSLLDALVDFFTWLLSPQDTVQAAAPAQAVPLPLQEDAPLGSYFLTGPVETTYLYDNLHRLTETTDNIGNTYAYAYDANGNRVSEQAPGGSPVISVYDQANRLTNVGGAPYAWDANGNLTNDGTRQYIYDQANRLKEVKDLNGDSLATYTYSGLGDRLTENNTQFVLDLNAGLTQVLQDGAYTYLYGSERLMQQSQASTDYFLGDALGSVRQLVDANGSVTLTKSYEPYGEIVSSSGLSATTGYGYTGEWESQGLIYLRARIYSPEMGRFLTRDTWQGEYTMPMSYNAWAYAYSNPLVYFDPQGTAPIKHLLATFSSQQTMYGKEDEVNVWTTREMSRIESDLWDIAFAFSRTYNRELVKRKSCDPYYFIVTGEKITPYKAFITVFDGPLMIVRSDNYVQDGAWGNYAGEDGSTKQNIIKVWKSTTIEEIINYRRFIIHEAGHAFEKEVYSKLNLSVKAGITDYLWNRDYDEESYGGFAGKEMWQYSSGQGGYEINDPNNPKDDTDGRGEIFADMFIGYVYNKWEKDIDNPLLWSTKGQQRADYMNSNMSYWIFEIINQKLPISKRPIWRDRY